MQDRQFQIQARRDFDERVKQEDRIGAAGDRDADAVARFEHVITGDSFENSFEHQLRFYRLLTDLSILTLDAGSSSVRTLLYDEQARQVPEFGSQLAYEADTTADGGVEI